MGYKFPCSDSSGLFKLYCKMIIKNRKVKNVLLADRRYSTTGLADLDFAEAHICLIFKVSAIEVIRCKKGKREFGISSLRLYRSVFF